MTHQSNGSFTARSSPSPIPISHTRQHRTDTTRNHTYRGGGRVFGADAPPRAPLCAPELLPYPHPPLGSCLLVAEPADGRFLLLPRQVRRSVGSGRIDLDGRSEWVETVNRCNIGLSCLALPMHLTRSGFPIDSISSPSPSLRPSPNE
jgi:hypothetical protein